MKRFTLYVFLSTISLILSCKISCQNPFAPSLADGNLKSSRLLTQQKTPDEVLQNFQFAYTFKDSLIYSEVLDSTFIFKSINYNEYPPQPIEWGRDTELRTTARMFRYFKTLDVVWNTITHPDTIKTEPDLIIEHRITFTLTLDGGSMIPPLNGEVKFQFIRRDEKFLINSWQDQKI